MPAILTSDGVKDLVQSLPEVSAWKDLADVFDRTGGAPHPDWQLPIVICQAAGGKSTDAAAAANDVGKTLSMLLSLGEVDIDLSSLRTEPVLGSPSEGE